MGWSDGSSFVPILLSLLSSANEKSRLVPMRDDLDKRTNGYKRRQESVRKSTDILVDLVSTGAVCPYQGPVSSFRQLVCLSRYNSKNTCTGDAHRLHAQRHAENQLHLWRETSHFEGVVQTGSQTSRRANVLATCLVIIGYDDNGQSVPAKIVFIRDRNSRSWLALLSTDTKLTDEEIVTLYKRRWDIETFFKIAKSFLKFAKESQSRLYDAMVAHATLVCCRYLMLEIGKKTTADPRT